MARYRFAFSGEPLGPPHGRLATVSHIRSVAKRDGANFVWHRPDGHDTRAYHGSLMFSLEASKQLRATQPGDVSKFTTRVDDPGFSPRTYRVLTLHPLPPSTPGEQAYERGMAELGTPYRFGADNGPQDAGPDYFDCSGLTKYCWEPWADLPHNAEMQRTSPLVTIIPLAQAQQGDLVLMNFQNERNIPWPQASHVGLFSKPGYMLDTRSTTEPVAIRPIEVGNVVGVGRVKV